ncbi:carbonic anhydrase, partial [Massilibacteroides sp.]|uniref:carbonic anhydrase n=1 Tax=Massilibacteroides sp. TaxID=2034766 RepID=UPI002623F571
IFFIGCSDSRISVEQLLQTDIGDVFVHRNIANLAPNNDFNFISALNYAVSHLKVKHIIVCGHYNCGGVSASMEIEDLGFLNPWIRNIRDVFRLHKEELESIKDKTERANRLIELNVIEQCVNIAKTVDVQKAYRSRRINLHGWVFDLHTGTLIDLKIDIDRIMRELDSIYRLV